MISDGYEWHYGRRCCGSEGPGQLQCSDTHYKLTIGDTFTYDNKHYKILNFWNGWYSLQSQTTTYDPLYVWLYALIREDSGRVYINYVLEGDSCGLCYEDSDPVDNEFVMYDFNLLPGDTFYLPYLSTYYDSCVASNFLTVVAVDSIEIGSIYRKVIKLKATFGPDNVQFCPAYQFEKVHGVQHADTLYWIEGIGSNKGLTYHINFEESFGGLLNCDVSFMCHRQAGEYIYGVGTCEFAVGIEEKVDLKSITIYPNPAAEFVSIDLPITHTKGTMQIYNLQGQLVKSASITGGGLQSFNIAEIPNGVYNLVVYSAANKLLGRQKLVVVR
jgi:hypothetical protein